MFIRSGVEDFHDDINIKSMEVFGRMANIFVYLNI
jgi:hypothetical protein